MPLIDRIREQTREALGADAEDPDLLTEEALEQLLGSEESDPDWDADPNVPEGVEPQAGAMANVYYCWNPVRIGSYWYFNWYMFTPPGGSCVNTTGRRIASLSNTGYRCGNGRYIYRLLWWS